MKSDTRPTDKLNPYAAPTVPDPLVQFAPMGVGVWRDGDHIVMHKDATLPSLCVRTGKPTRHRVAVEAPWLHRSFKFYITSRRLVVPLAERWRRNAVWCRQNMLLWTFGLFFGAFAIAGTLHNTFAWNLEVPTVLCAAAVFMALTIWACMVGDPLSFERSEGHYVWLRGADKRFLEHLPEWKPYE
jgi:hypothetical protein